MASSVVDATDATTVSPPADAEKRNWTVPLVQ